MKLRNKKTGDAVYVDFRIPLSNNDETLGSYCVTSLEELNRNFEDYKPADPLIKDEKIRKAVRAWAEANGYGKDEVYEFEDFLTGSKSWSLEHKVNGDDNEIHFNGGIDFDKVEHQGYYTIAELCGEEEE